MERFVDIIHQRAFLQRWSEIALSIPGRKGKQCRERYLNHLDPNLNKAPWTVEEDLILTEKHEQIGNRWSEIAKFLPGRAENAVKNRFHLTHKNYSYWSSASSTPSSAKKSRLLSAAPVVATSTSRPSSPAPEPGLTSCSRATSPETVPASKSPAYDSLLPLSCLASSLMNSQVDLDEAKLSGEHFVMGSLDVKLVFDENGMAHLERLDKPLMFVAPRAF